MNDLLLSNAQIDFAPTANALRHTQSQSEATRIAKEFEAVFITEMMKPMFEGVDIANSQFGGGKGEEVFNKLLLQEYGTEISKRGGLGIAEEVEKMILEIQAQEQDNAPHHPQRTIGDVINAYATQHTSQK